MSRRTSRSVVTKKFRGEIVGRRPEKERSVPSIPTIFVRHHFYINCYRGSIFGSSCCCCHDAKDFDFYSLLWIINIRDLWNRQLTTSNGVLSHSQKKLRFSQNRPKTAPNAKASINNDSTRSFLTSSNLPSSLRAKKNNQVSPIGDNFSLRFNYEIACERHIREGLKAGLINGILTVSEQTGKNFTFPHICSQNLRSISLCTEKSRDLDGDGVIVVEDLSLPPSHQQAVIS